MYKYLKILMIVLMLTLAFGALYKLNISNSINIGAVRDLVAGYGKLAGIMFIIVVTLRTLLIFTPFSLFIVVGGNIFGPVWGFVFALLSTFLSANLAFGLSRILGQGFVEKLAGNRINKLSINIEKHCLKIIILMRLSLIFPFDILNYAAGLTKARYRDFIIGTLIGMTPELFCLTYLGYSFTHPYSPKTIIALGLVLLTIIIPVAYNKRKRIKEVGIWKAWL